ncbi:MAG: adenylate/guanylate cyclase domain-containing protein [Proteobacteria bacterium]|nr:adenylate/guanylate cyclase domain-containing protein [Pseudomonadota bacterium]
MKQNIVRIALGLAIVLVFIGHAAKFYQVGIVTQLDHIIYDTRLKVSMPGGIDDRIVILDIDEKSLQEVARWPWPRDLMARLVTRLFDEYQVAIIAFDVVFAESDYSSGIKRLDELAAGEFRQVPGFAEAYGSLRPKLDNDGLFAQAIKGRPVVLGYYFNSDKGARKIAVIPDPVLPKGTFTGRNIAFTTWAGFGGNIAQIQHSAASAGHINSLPDFDGVVRRVPMLAEHEGAYYEAFSLAIVRTLLGFPKVELGYGDEGSAQKGYAGLEWLKVGPLTIPVDETASALVPYRGEKSSFRYVSLADVLSGRIPPGSLKGRIALVGTTAPGLLDLRATPVDSVYPGVEVHANLIGGMLDRAIKQKPPYVLGAEVVLLLIGGVVLAFVLPMLSPLFATLASLAAMGLIIVFNYLVWTEGGLVLPLASSLLMTVGMFTTNMAYGYFVESRSKRQFTELFGQYVPPELVDKMAQDPEKYSMEGRSEQLTVLFSDIVGFTSISEALSPKDLSAFINEYLTSMSLVIREHRGTLDKYIGDAIMAFWGAPVEDPEHARQGVLSALAMQARLLEINELIRARGWPPIRIGIGVNSGTMSVGDMGSKVRRAYTVMGDAVNLGSRLEALTRVYGVGIIVGQATRDLVKDGVFRELDKVKVKGKDEPVAIFEAVGMEGSVSEAMLDEIRLWNKFLKQYRAQEWDQAEVTLLNLSRMKPDHKLYQEFSGRIAQLRSAPPGPGWDGVTTFKTK